VWDDLVLVYFEGEVWKQEIEHLGFKAQYSNIDEWDTPDINKNGII
jgi:hypothetical protein